MHYTEHKAAGTEFIHSLHSNSTGTPAEYVALDPCDVNDKKKKKDKKEKNPPHKIRKHKEHTHLFIHHKAFISWFSLKRHYFWFEKIFADL